MDKIEKIQKELHKINFDKNDGILSPEPVRCGEVTAEEYCFEKLIKGGEKREHVYKEEFKPYCTECDKSTECVLQDDKGGKFTNITHGAHTLDFLDAHNKAHDVVQKWSKKPVLFVMENPGSYQSENYGSPVSPPAKGTRYPCKWWYWINGQDSHNNDDFKYPKWFTQKEYGWMIYSVINTFQISNAYITNMVKCGACNGQSKFVTTDRYNPEIIEKCLSKHLTREISALRGDDHNQLVTVFAFGQNVYDTLKSNIEKLGKCKIYLLPHPANHLANDYRKYVLFGKILHGLLQSDFYDNVTMPDFYAIIKSDEEREENYELNIDYIRKCLKEYKLEDIELKKSAKYEDGIITYQVCLDKFSVLQVIFRYSDEKQLDYTVSWACYYPETGAICLYRGKDKKAKSSNLFVESGHDHYIVFRLLRKFAEDFSKKYPVSEISIVTKLSSE